MKMHRYIFKLKKLIAFNFLLGTFFLSNFLFENNIYAGNNSQYLDGESYLVSRGNYDDYILGIGDVLYLDFFPQVQFSGLYTIDVEGEIYLPILKKTYVKGLTRKELNKLLEETFADLISITEISSNIVRYRPLIITIKGEVRSPGDYSFKGYTSKSFNDSLINSEKIIPIKSGSLQNKFSSKKSNNQKVPIEGEITTLKKVIYRAGGLTSFSDTANIEIIRNVPISEGGGKKKAIINLNNSLIEGDNELNFILYSGDRINIPRLKQPDHALLPKSILKNISPRFIRVNISGQIENPQSYDIPLEGTLSDLIDLSGPRKPLAGKVVLIRYNKDGSYINKKIKYNSKAARGSSSNPYLKDGDLISVTDSIFRRTNDFVREVTSPFIGIFTTKEVLEDLIE